MEAPCHFHVPFWSFEVQQKQDLHFIFEMSGHKFKLDTTKKKIQEIVPWEWHGWFVSGSNKKI